MRPLLLLLLLLLLLGRALAIVLLTRCRQWSPHQGRRRIPQRRRPRSTRILSFARTPPRAPCRHARRKSLCSVGRFSATVPPLVVLAVLTLSSPVLAIMAPHVAA